MGPTEQLRTMVTRGRSFSGHERNCAYLNLGESAGTPPSFANFSAGSGLDFDDDARAIALTDWDHDGDLDVWITNRNAPRLRLMRNEMPPGRSYLSLRLQGDGMTTNRDAIGARVEVVAGGIRQIRGLRAGEGFISQSSQRLHFGLGDATEIASVRVRWPDGGGAVEEFTGIAPGARYLLVQGRGAAQLEPRRTATDLAPAPQEPSPPGRTARVPLVTLLDIPPLQISDAAGRSVRVGAGSPVLINLWASWCAPCLTELAEIRDREADIRSAGLEVVALSVNALDSATPEAAAADAAAAVAGLRFPFISAVASEQIVGLLQWHHDNAVGRKRRLPLPSSFLIDSDGRAAVIYKGRLPIDALLSDLAHSYGTRSERWTRAAMLPGRTIDHESVARSAAKIDAKLYFDHAQQQESHGATAQAIKYYEESIRNWPSMAPARRSLGNLYANQRRWRDALAEFEQLATLQPDDAATHFALAICQQHLGELAAARAHLETTLRLEPGHRGALKAIGALGAAEP